MQLMLSFLGSFQAIHGGQPVTFATNAARALLAYLGVEADRPHSRELLASLLWPEQPQITAFANLRQTLARLRKGVAQLPAGDSMLHVTPQTLQFKREAAFIDVACFEDLLAECAVHAHSSTTGCPVCIQRLQQAAALYRGDFLHGLFLTHSQSFDEWMLLKREQLHRQILEVLHTLAFHHESTSEYEQMSRCATRQLALEPWREEAHGQLMRALAYTGHREAAMLQYKTCCRLLNDELGVAPLPETTRLYEQIKSGEAYRFTAPIPLARVETAEKILTHHDWDEVPETGPLFGRQAEMAQLEQWLIHDRCRVVVISGMGGVGKTTLAASAVRAALPHFGKVIWRSLLNTPSLDEVLHATLLTLSGHKLAELPTSLDERLALVLDYLCRQRCLLVLDNLESIFHPQQVGDYRPGYEAYGRFIRQLAENRHGSCLLLTSREQPTELRHPEEGMPWLRSLRLEGLDPAAGREMLTVRGLTGQKEDVGALVTHYSGNPLALKVVARTIQDLFFGDIEAFLGAETPIFDGIRTVLDQQFARLPALEREILTWLAIEREPITLPALRGNLIEPGSARDFVEALLSLQRRSLLEQSKRPTEAAESVAAAWPAPQYAERTSNAAFTLQNVIMEYVTDRLVEDACREIENGRLDLLNRHALLKADAKEHVRQSQARLILKPVADRLVMKLGKTGLAERLQRILAALREEKPVSPGYSAGNILNLLLHLGVELSGYDFSGLSVWQAYLRGQELPGVNLSHTDVRGAVFTDTFTYSFAVAYSPDGQCLAAGLVNGEIRLWRASNGQMLGAYKGHTKAVRSIAFSPDGAILASSSEDHTVRLWDRSNGQLLGTLRGHEGRVYAVAFSPDGRCVASGGEDMAVRLWDVRSPERGHPLRTLRGHTGWVWAIDFSPNGGHVISGGLDGTVRVWDVDAGQASRVLDAPAEWVRSAVFSPDGNTIAVGGGDSTIRVWDARNGRLLRQLRGHGAAITALVFSPDGSILASGSEDRTVRMWAMCAHEPAERGQRRDDPIDLLLGHRASVLALSYSPDGTTLASSSYDQTIRLWDVRTIGRSHPVTVLQGYSRGFRAIAVSPDGSTLASGGIDRAVRVWDIRRGQVLSTFPGNTMSSGAVAYSADGNTLASVGEDRSIRLRHLSTGQTHTLQDGYPSERVSLALSPDGKSLATGSFDGMIHLWADRAQGHEVTGQSQAPHILCGHTGIVTAVAFSPDGRTLASSSYDTHIRLWNVRGAGGPRQQATRAQDDCRCVLKGHTGWIWSVAFSPDGASLASGSADRTIRLWPARTPEGATSHPIFRGHTDWVFSIAFSPDGKTLVSGSADRTLRVWDVDTGDCVRTLHGHTGWVWSVAFHPNGRTVFSGGIDETIRLWDIGSGACLATFRAPGPYAGMNIAGMTGITEAQRLALKVLGAIV